MKCKIKFYVLETGKKVLNSSIYFIDHNGKVCQIISRGDDTFLSAAPDIGYVLERNEKSKAKKGKCA